jgi:predicted DNA-binding protein
MARRKISTTVYITREQDELLKRLSQHTKVPVAEFIRQGIDLVLERRTVALDQPAGRGI